MRRPSAKTRVSIAYALANIAASPRARDFSQTFVSRERVRCVADTHVEFFDHVRTVLAIMDSTNEDVQVRNAHVNCIAMNRL